MTNTNQTEIIKALYTTIEELMAEAGGEPDMDSTESIETWDRAYTSMTLVESYMKQFEVKLLDPSEDFEVILDCAEPEIAVKQLEQLGLGVIYDSREDRVYVKCETHYWNNFKKWLADSNYSLEALGIKEG